MNLYLYTVVNTYPSINTRYKYLILADNRQAAINKMQTCDGGGSEYDIFESCEVLNPVDFGVWYLPEYTPEKII